MRLYGRVIRGDHAPPPVAVAQLGPKGMREQRARLADFLEPVPERPTCPS